MSTLTHRLSSSGAGVSALRGRLIRATRGVQDGRSIRAVSWVSHRLPQELLGGDLLDVLSEPLRALADGQVSEDAEPLRARAQMSDRTPATVVGRASPFAKSERASPAVSQRFGAISDWGEHRSFSGMERDATPIHTSRPTTASGRAALARPGRTTLTDAIEKYWSSQTAPGEKAGATPAAIAGRVHMDPATVPPTYATEWPTLAADQLALRLRQFESPRALSEHERPWGQPSGPRGLPTYQSEPRSFVLSAGGEPIEASDDLAERIASLLRDQAIAHGIDVS